VTSSGIEFDSEYGVGTLEIEFDDIEGIKTDEPLLILYGDELEAFGRLIGVEDGQLLVLEKATAATRVTTDSIVDSDNADESDTIDEKIRNKYRFWDASVDLGLSFKDSTTDEFDTKLGANVEYRRRPVRLVAQANYIIGQERESGRGTSRTDNEVRGLIKGEYDISKRFFLYASNDFEHDEIDRLSLRWVAKPGPGYRLLDTDAATIQVETGIAYVHERFFGGDREDTAGVPFGAELSIELPQDMRLTARADYLPSLEDWTGDYLIRAEAAFQVPISKYLAFKVSVFEAYDEVPDKGVDRNTFKMILSLAWTF
jgi:hypothetical protein